MADRGYNRHRISGAGGDSASSSSVWTIPAIMSHDPPMPASSEPDLSVRTLPPKPSSNGNFLSRLGNIIKRGPPPKPHLVHKVPSLDNDYRDIPGQSSLSFENPGYGNRSDAIPSRNAENVDEQATPQPAVRLDATGSTEMLQSDGNDGVVASSKQPAPSGEDGTHAGDENKVRGNWGSHLEFVLSCIGYAVGLGNVWRFPYLCYKNGGGSFLMIYWVLSATVGLPIIFLELSLGQFTSQGPTGVWNYAPVVKGLGYSMCAISGIGAIYYNVIISWALYYLFASFRYPLLWTECDFDSWADYRCELPKVACLEPFQFRANDGLCYTMQPYLNARLQPPRILGTYCKNSNATTSVVPCFYIIDEIIRNRTTVVGCWDERLAFDRNRGPQFSTEQFFFRQVLGQNGKTGSGHSAVSLGPPQKWLALCLLLAWILVFLCLLNGIKSSGKVVYFTALFPYLVLAVLIGRGVTLPGAYDGIMYFLKPDFEKIKDPNVWYAAASQLFFSLSACWGGMMALSSYNKFHTNTLRDALIVTAADTFTSFFASFAIFSVIGYGAHILQKPVDEVADAGTGLAFILYPKIIDSLPGSTAWAIMFFFMLLLLGLDSEFNSLETIFTALLDSYPNLRSSLKKKALAFGLFCIPFFLLGLPMICPGGLQLLELIDDYGPGWPVFLIGIVETLSVAWIYGTARFSKDLSAMMPWLLNGKRRAKIVPWILRIYWGFITPFMLTFILIYSWTKYEPRALIGEEILGWCVTIFVIIWVPAFALWVIFQNVKKYKSCWTGFKHSFSPSAKWRPFLSEHHREVLAIHGDLLRASASMDNSLDLVIDDRKSNNYDADSHLGINTALAYDPADSISNISSSNSRNFPSRYGNRKNDGVHSQRSNNDADDVVVMEPAGVRESYNSIFSTVTPTPSDRSDRGNQHQPITASPSVISSRLDRELTITPQSSIAFHANLPSSYAHGSKTSLSSRSTAV